MALEALVAGCVVISRAGRDRGKAFMVWEEADEDFVMIVDGMFHKIAKPKRKRRKHLLPQGHRLEAIAAKHLDGKPVFDAEIRSSLDALGYTRREVKED